MKMQYLDPQHYLFGNKGSLWSEQAHIAQSGFNRSGTNCGIPMLSSNWIAIEGVEQAGCAKCIKRFIDDKTQEYEENNQGQTFIEWLIPNSYLDIVEALRLIDIAADYTTKTP